MNSDTQQLGICALFVLVILFMFHFCTIKKLELEAKTEIACAQAGLEQKRDKETDFRTIWVKK